MTKLWGPMGWMTLHSVSLIYPETPTPAERALAGKFLDLFTNTISCIHCQNHFKTMRSIYAVSTPNYLESRQTFALFVFRAHNTVNKRLDKPIQGTVSECLQALKNATSQTSFAQFRHSYISYLLRNWGRDMSGDGFFLKKQATEMMKINNEYWSLRDIPIPDLLEEDVLTPIENFKIRRAPSGVMANVDVGFRGGRLRLMRK